MYLKQEFSRFECEERTIENKKISDFYNNEKELLINYKKRELKKNNEKLTRLQKYQLSCEDIRKVNQNNLLNTLSFQTYNHGIVISGTIKSENNFKKNNRGSITDLKKASRKRLSWVYMQGEWKSMLTFTYHNITIWNFNKVKKQLNSLLQNFRREGVKYLWVMEWQLRGAPHFHIWLDRKFDDCHVRKDNFGKNSWRRFMWSWLKITNQDNDDDCSSFSFHQKNYTDWDVREGINYASKYLEKSNQKVLPKNIKNFGRWWGCSRDLKLEKKQFIINNATDIQKQNFNIFRRIAKKYIQKQHCFKFSNHVIGSRFKIRWSTSKKTVEVLEKLAEYYFDEIPF